MGGGHLERASDPAPACGREPGPGFEPLGRTVGGEHHYGSLADEVSLWNHADAFPLDRREAAVERIVAVVAHQEHVVFRHDEHAGVVLRSEEHTSELQSLLRSSYAV